jgi:hypothetical protein
MTDALEFRRLAEVEMRSIEWLDKPLWQRAAFQLVAGRKGAGKGTYLAGLAARTSRGDLFGGPRNVLIVATEDSDEIDVKPRVVAAGGDVDRIYSLNSAMLLPRDVPALRLAALEIGDVGLIILDPIASHVRGDTHAEEPVRNAIDPLNGLANELDCLLIGVRHLSEKSALNGALAAILGASAWVQVPRAVLAVAPDDEEQMLFHIAVVSGNRSARGAGRTFRIDLVDVGLDEPVTQAVEAGLSNKSVDDLLSAGADEKRKAPKREGARAIILRELALEPSQLDHIKAVCAAEIAVSGDTVWQAANELKAEGLVRCSNKGFGTPWIWTLTTDFVPNTDPDYEVDNQAESQTDFSTKSHQTPHSEDYEQGDLTTNYSKPTQVSSFGSGTPPRARAHEDEPPPMTDDELEQLAAIANDDNPY